MVNVSKKLSDVAFQNPTGFSVVFADFVPKLLKTVKRPMRPFPDLTRIGVGDKNFIEKRVKNSVYRVV